MGKKSRKPSKKGQEEWNRVKMEKKAEMEYKDIVVHGFAYLANVPVRSPSTTCNCEYALETDDKVQEKAVTLFLAELLISLNTEKSGAGYSVIRLITSSATRRSLEGMEIQLYKAAVKHLLRFDSPEIVYVYENIMIALYLLELLISYGDFDRASKDWLQVTIIRLSKSLPKRSRLTIGFT